MQIRTNGSWASYNYSIMGQNTATVENSKTIPIYSDGSNLTDYSFKGQCSQASTPTPTVPVEVEEFGDKTVNLYNDSTTMDGYRIYWSNGNLYADSNAATSDYIDVQSGGSYVSNVNVFIAGYASDKSYLGVWNGTEWKKDGTATARNNIAVPSGCEYIRLIAVNKSILHNNFMLNSGSTALPYEPYGKYKIPITSAGQTKHIVLAEPLRKIGTYADTVDSDGILTRRIKKIVFDGTEDWQVYENPYKWMYITIDVVQIADGLCTHFLYGYENLSFYILASSSPPYYDHSFIYFRYLFNLTDWKAYLAQQYANGTPVTVYYVLKTPTTELIHGNNFFDDSKSGMIYVNASTQRYGTSLGALKAGTYTISYILDSPNSNMFYGYRIGDTYQSGLIQNTSQASASPYTLTLPSDVDDFFIRSARTDTSMTWAEQGYSNIMINEGSTALPYEPYQNAPTIPTSSGYSNIEIGTSLAPSRFEYDLGKMFIPQEEKVRVNGEWV